MSKSKKTGGILSTSQKLVMNPELIKRPAKLTPKQVDRINQVNAKHKAELLATRVTYPTDVDFGDITEEMAKGLGFRGKSKNDISAGLADIGLDFTGINLGVANKAKKAKPKTLPDPKVVADFVKQRLAPISVADLTGPVRVFSQNFEFLTDDKVAFFKDSYKEIFKRFHIITATEVSPDGVKALCKLTGFEHFVSGDNTRGGQAVAVFYDPKRLKAKGGRKLIDEVANVQGVNDLRPMLWCTLIDSVNGDEVNVGVNHLKSMRGGPQQTGVIRKQQAQAIVRGLPKGWQGVMGGDWNTRMNDGWHKIDLKPLLDDGFILVDQDTNKLATHTMGGWLDGFFTRTQKTVSGMTVIQWFLDTKRDLTDHAGVLVSIG